MAKPASIKIRLNSTADTGHFYVTKKNARTMTEKMTIKKWHLIKKFYHKKKSLTKNLNWWEIMKINDY